MSVILEVYTFPVRITRGIPPPPSQHHWTHASKFACRGLSQPLSTCTAVVYFQERKDMFTYPGETSAMDPLY